jgi:ABC-2 type transport system permease protein
VIALVRTEFTKATRRMRTLVIALLLIGLPTLISVAVRSHGEVRRGPEREGLFFLATQSGLLVPAAVLSVTSAFLLIVIASMFAGDSVAGDAASGNLRYLLMRPVSRVRLLFAKAFVAGVLIWAATVLVAVAALVAGVVLFGSHPVQVPGVGNLLGGSFANGFELTTGELLGRSAVATAYVAFGFTALLAFGTLFSTVTDSPAGAIGATAGVYIVSEILDGISQLGRIRTVLPTHYGDAWRTLFLENRYSHDMLTGIGMQVLYLVVVGGVAAFWFRTKDIRS